MALIPLSRCVSGRGEQFVSGLHGAWERGTFCFVRREGGGRAPRTSAASTRDSARSSSSTAATTPRASSSRLDLPRPRRSRFTGPPRPVGWARRGVTEGSVAPVEPLQLLYNRPQARVLERLRQSRLDAQQRLPPALSAPPRARAASAPAPHTLECRPAPRVRKPCAQKAAHEGGLGRAWGPARRQLPGGAPRRPRSTRVRPPLLRGGPARPPARPPRPAPPLRDEPPRTLRAPHTPPAAVR